MRTLKIAAVAGIAAAGIITPAVSAFAATPPTTGVGTALANPAVSWHPVAPGWYIAGYIGDKPGSLSTAGDKPVAKGSTSTWQIAVQNTGSQTETIGLSAQGGASGSWGYMPSNPQNAVSSWTALSASRVTLAPGQYAFPTVTVKVPQGAHSGLQTEATVWAYTFSPAPNGGGVSVRTGVASGVREYLNVAP